MKFTTNKKIRIEFYLHKEAKNKFLQVYCLVTFNRKTTRFPVRGIIKFTSQIVTEEDFESYSFSKHEDEIRRLILHEISIVGEDRFSVKGLSSRLQFYLNSVLESVVKKLNDEQYDYLGSNLSYFDFIEFESQEGLSDEVFGEIMAEMSTKCFSGILSTLYLLITHLEKDIKEIFDDETFYKYSLALRFFEIETIERKGDKLFTNFDWFFGEHQKKIAHFLEQNKTYDSIELWNNGFELYKPIAMKLRFKNKKNDLLFIENLLLEDEQDELKFVLRVFKQKTI